MRSIPSLDSIKHVINDNADAKQFLLDNNVFYASLPCPKCGKEMNGMSINGHIAAIQPFAGSNEA